MSDDRLVLDRLSVDQFGGWSNRSIDIPSDRFVVLHGSNESGKSTISELLAWLIAGPAGTARGAQRFGLPDDHIGGSLAGRLRGAPFETRGKFRVLQRQPPNSSGLTANMGGALNLESWLAQLGDLDPVVLGAIYRLSGEDLHEGSAVEDHLGKVALGALAGRVDPRTMVEDLGTQRQRLTTSRAAGVVSVASLADEIKELKDQRAAAYGNSAAFNAKADEHARMAEDRQRELVALTTVRDERARVKALLAAAPYRNAIESCEQELSNIEAVPPAWSGLIQDPAAFASALDRLRRAEADAEGAANAATWSAQQLGCTVMQLAGVSIHEGAILEIQSASQKLADADGKLADAKAEVREAELSKHEAEETVSRTLDALGTTRAEVAKADFTPASSQSYSDAVSLWRSSLVALDNAVAELNRANAECEVAKSKREAAEATWERRGTGVAAEEWLHGQITQPKSSPGVRLSVRHVAVTALCVLALLGVVLAQWLFTAISVVGAIAILLFARYEQAKAVVVIDEAARSAAIDDATAVRTARESEATAATAQSGALAAHSRCVDDAERRAQDVRGLANDLGFPAAQSPEACQPLRQRWLDASNELDAEVAASTRLGKATEAVELASRQVDEAVEALELLIGQCGLRGLSSARGLREAAPKYRDAATKVAEARNREAEVGAALQAVEALLVDVQPVTVGWRFERILDEVERLHGCQTDREAVESRLEKSRRDLKVALGDLSDVDSWLAEPLDVSGLEAQLSSATDEVGAVDARVKQLSEDIGRLAHEMQQLSEVEVLASINDEIGALREQQDDVVMKAASVALAAQLIHELTGEYERKNQPALVAEASRLACGAASLWSGILVRRDTSGKLEVEVEEKGRGRLPAATLSTGARALLYMAFRISLAEHDARRRGLRLPILCDDPLVHLDDQRAADVAPLLASAADNGHQVLLFTCHQRTVDIARAVGAEVVEIASV